jgi:glyoxylase-like metal-dependent hydrolase (beta-lactamase superfamily II)/rhodanese-related sulfurtransferase
VIATSAPESQTPGPAPAPGAVPTIAVDDLRSWLEERRPVTVLDVRQREARAEWSIPGSVYMAAYDALRAGDPDALDPRDFPRGGPVVAVCNVGRTSAIAARVLRDKGMQAFSLEGGMKAWSLAWNTAPVILPGTAAEVVQVRRTGKGCLAYLIGAAGEAVILDAALDAAIYVELAQSRGWRIRHVLETHIHADHLSRARSLAGLTGAALRLPETRRVSFSFEPVSDGDKLVLGPARLRALRVPGHTRESTAFLLDDRALFTGDTLFTAGVGRPDLAADPAESRSRAHALYGSLRRILELPGDTLVLPAHAPEPIPFDGRAVAAPLDEVRARLPLLDEGEDAFVEAILGRIPPTPPNHLRIVELNEAGLLPDGDPTDLEAGANRCAIS